MEHWLKGWDAHDYEEKHGIVHVAGAMENGVQHCIVCGFILTDLRNAMSPEGSGGGDLGWTQGSEVTVVTSGPQTSMSLGATKRVPHCKPI
jgi:hypothetical protein